MRKQFATFRLDEQLFGIEVLLVREINQQMDITLVQQAPEHVRGLINLRGQIITIFDLGVRLGLKPRDITTRSHSVILKTEDELGPVRHREGREDLRSSGDAVGLLVDLIGDVVEEDETEIEPPPANVGDVDGRFLSGVIKLEEDLLVLLDVKQVLGLDG
jgi:purine-binding chemotaxis protein CheW